MSICIALGKMLGRSIQTLYVNIKKKRETEEEEKREQQRLSEQSYESACFRSSMQSSRGEYQHLNGHEHPGGEILRDLDHHDEQNTHRMAVAPSTFQILDDCVNTEVGDTPPMYDHNATRLPPYDHTLPNLTASFPGCGRGRQREGSRSGRHDGINLVTRNGRQINKAQPRARACTGMRIRSEYPGLESEDHREAVIWYDALEDRYEVISRSLAPPTEPPLPPPYMPNSCVDSLLI